MAKSGGWFFNASGVTSVLVDWQATQRKAAAQLIPVIQMELKRAAPVSATKPDAGRFRDSIGYRVDSAAGVLNISFVSVAPYAEYVIKPTTGGTLIQPVNTMALRFKNGFGDYVFANSVIRGSTPGNDFNVRVAKKMKPVIEAAFADSITVIKTSD